MIEQLKDKASEYLSDAPDERNAGIEPAENALAFVTALGCTFLARNLIQSGWRAALDRDPPKNPASHEVDWQDALLWGAVSGAVVGVARIASRRASSSAYRAIRS
ncbi:hypothetical protein LF1_40260 [Rubripirellula obstinata]|uniref:DUF4235 domain-containing protein n=1 Tax=Rubripirellula obstinata TaxID=406547 RepID=A0A5B1CLR9_9BACT|nr:DUF4235 domain-containing protein [Rubripirellula obstinata]KAA1261476.1 hypothetical protein LF1_40260 [Rubripirellula obstinata]